MLAQLCSAALATPGGCSTVGIRAAVETWSLFANVLNYVIVAAVFLLEFAYRRRRFPGRPYRGSLDFLRRTAARRAGSRGDDTAANRRVREVRDRVHGPDRSPGICRAFSGTPGASGRGAARDRHRRGRLESLGAAIVVTGLPRAKFTAPLAPGDRGSIRLKRSPGPARIRSQPRRGAGGAGRIPTARGRGFPMTDKWIERPEGGAPLALRLLCGFALTFGRAPARAVLHPITLYFMLRRGPERRASREFLSRVLGRRASARGCLSATSSASRR